LFKSLAEASAGCPLEARFNGNLAIASVVARFLNNVITPM